MDFYVKRPWAVPSPMAKILRVMKLTVILIMAAILQVSASGFAQNLTLKTKNASLKQVFSEIKKQTGLNILYRSSDIKDAKPINVNIDAKPIEEAMVQILQNQALDFGITDKNIVIRPKEEKGLIDKIKDYFAQIDVSGKVVDENGQPIGGASVLVLRTGKGMSTRVDGTFTLSSVEEGEILIIKYLGFDKKEVVATKNLGTIKLTLATNELDQIQIQAYGTTSRRLSTSNISTIKAEDIEKQPINNPLLALAGRVPGLTVFQSTGTPGSTVSVKIQGATSMRAGVEPFYVVDGVPYDSNISSSYGGSNIFGRGPASLNSTTSNAGSPFNYINPSDIESIDVLKDADATAIYGSRAASGAIIITTKKGKPGELKVDLNLNQGISQVSSRIDLLDNNEFLRFRKEILRNGNLAIGSLASASDYDLNGFWDQARNVDWQREIYGKSTPYTNTNLSLSGGNLNNQYRAAFTYNRQGSPLPKDISSSDMALSLSLNNRSSNGKFRSNFALNFFRNNSTLQNADLSPIIAFSPLVPDLYTEGGDVNWAINPTNGRTSFNVTPSETNPLGILESSFNAQTNNFVGSAQIGYEIFKGLQLQSNLGYTYRQSDINTKTPITSVEPISRPTFTRRASQNFVTDYSLLIEPQIQYLNRFGKHDLNILLGSTVQTKTRKGTTFGGSGMPSDALLDNLGSATSITAGVGDFSVYKYNAGFGRINYSYGNQYLVNITARRDGSSRFGRNNVFANFYAVGAAWIFSESTFVKEKLDFLSFGKLKFSYGTTGNDQIGDYTFLDISNLKTYGINYQSSIGLENTRFYTPDLKWERTRKVNYGLDLAFFKDRILLGVNYANNTTLDMLQDLALPSYNGPSTVLVNFPGTLKINSLELSLNTINIKSQNFRWETNFNYTFNNQRLNAFPNASQLVLSAVNRNISVGQPLTSVRTYKYLGIDPLTGQARVADKNGNPTGAPVGFDALQGTAGSPVDATELVHTNTRFNGGIGNTLSYKDFSLSIDIQYVNRFVPRIVYLGSFINAGTNALKSTFENSWHNPGDVARIQSQTSTFISDPYLLSGSILSDQAYEDGSFLRVRNIAVSWSMPSLACKKLGLKAARINLRAQNLFTLTGYNGLDPESLGIQIPPMRTITLGINSSF